MRTQLERVTATGGYLERCEIRFNTGLNCIIGARGTCKSTLIESIRFAFDADPDRVQTLRGERPDGTGLSGIISATLGSGTVKCDVVDLSSDTAYSIERDLQSGPRIYREGVKDHTDTKLRHQVEIYSQGDLQRIAEDEHLRLTLVDRPNIAEIQTLRVRQAEAATELRELGPKVRNARAQAAQLRVQLRSLPELRGQLADIQASRPELSRELDAQRGLFLQRQAAVQAIGRSVSARDEAVSLVLEARDRLDAMEVTLQQLRADPLPEVGMVEGLLEQTVSAFAALIGQAEAVRDIPLAEALDRFQEIVDALNEPYFALRRQEQEANEVLKKEDTLKQQIEHLQHLSNELSTIEEQLQSLCSRRMELRQAIERLGDGIFELRSKEVEAINERHGDLVILMLEHGSLGAGYLDRVQQLLRGSGLRNQDEIARELATLLSPANLVDLVEAGDAHRLAAVLNRDPAQITRLIAFLLDSPGLYDLEGHVFEDGLSITLFDEGQPKPVQTLSKGQKATALLPLILRDAPYPLVFDQPEDDLDNRFVFSSLVQAIRELKGRRQLVFVTHNANIPVIGEAETVVVMRMDSPTKAAMPVHGTVDERQKDIVDLLEGGAEAFRERQRRYHQLLTREGWLDASR